MCHASSTLHQFVVVWLIIQPAPKVLSASRKGRAIWLNPAMVSRMFDSHSIFISYLSRKRLAQFQASRSHGSLNVVFIPGSCVQYPGLQGGGALGDASTPGTPAGSTAASAHGGTYSHVAVAGGAWGRKRGTAAATARRRPAGVARRPQKEPSLCRAAHLRTVDGSVDTAHGRAGGTDRARRGASNRAARWRQKPPTSRRNRGRRAGTITRGSSWARRTPVVAARGFRAQLEGSRGAGAVRKL